MKIFVDMDQTLNNFTNSFVKVASEVLDEDLTEKAKDIGSRWGLQDILFNDHSNKDLVTEKIFNTPGFWLNMEIQDHAHEVISKLSKNHDVYIVTFPWPSSLNCYVEKYLWVKKNLPSFDLNKLIYVKDKHLLHGDIIIDDKPSYLSNNNCTKTIAFDCEYNKDVETDFRSNDWLEIYKYIKSL